MECTKLADAILGQMANMYPNFSFLGVRYFFKKNDNVSITTKGVADVLSGFSTNHRITANLEKIKQHIQKNYYNKNFNLRVYEEIKRVNNNHYKNLKNFVRAKNNLKDTYTKAKDEFGKISKSSIDLLAVPTLTLTGNITESIKLLEQVLKLLDNKTRNNIIDLYLEAINEKQITEAVTIQLVDAIFKDRFYLDKTDKTFNIDSCSIILKITQENTLPSFKVNIATRLFYGSITQVTKDLYSNLEKKQKLLFNLNMELAKFIERFALFDHITYYGQLNNDNKLYHRLTSTNYQRYYESGFELIQVDTPSNTSFCILEKELTYDYT